MGFFDLFRNMKPNDTPNDRDLRNDPIQDDIAWVQDFNISLGDELGGIHQIMDAFSNDSGMIKHFIIMVNKDMEASKSMLPPITRTHIISEYLQQVSEPDRRLLLIYWGFFGEACSRLSQNHDFASWIRADHHFTTMPDIFTYEILKIACQVLGC